MEMQAPGFWDDPEKANEKTKTAKNLKDLVDKVNGLSRQHDDILELIAMGYEENDPEIVPDIRAELDEFITVLEDLRISTLLSGEYDRNNAILRLNAGAGGTESCDWCGMLYRMYTRWAEKRGFQVEELDMLEGDEAGIKSVSFQINGENAYGYLKSEHGVHRLVRISPFNAQGKRQTSFVSLDVMPEITDDLDIEIKDDDDDDTGDTGSSHEHTYHICEDGHKFAYCVMQAPTTEVDGFAEWRCTQCGIYDWNDHDNADARETVVLSAYPVFNDTLEKNIKAAEAGATVSITTSRWVSVRRGVLEALAEKPGVTLTVNFEDQGTGYVLSVPGGDPALAGILASEDRFFSFSSLGNTYGLTAVEK